MSRHAPSSSDSGLWYFVISAAGALPPWPKERDRFTFLALLRREMRAQGAACAGYSLLNWAAHLLIEAGVEEAGAAAGAAMRSYARYWRGWYAPGRRVFRAARAVCVPEEHRWDALAHLETEPVRAGLCGSAESYRWSSAMAHGGWGQAYLPLEMEEWRAEWTCAGWRERLESWDTDLRKVQAVVRLLERARPLRAPVAPPEPAAPPLFVMAAGAGRAAAARA
jgi:putative transposase